MTPAGGFSLGPPFPHGDLDTMASRKLPKRLFKNQEVVHTYQHDRESKLDMKQMSRDHLDVLQNIEFTLITTARQDREIDDRTIDEALRIALRGGEPEEDTDGATVELVELLDEMREFRSEVPDNVWQAGLKTVRDSVRKHSGLTPGEKRYIRFVEPYVK
jgi:hypothetical protein